MKRIFIFSCVIALNISNNVNAQFKCGADHKMREVFNAYPGLEEEHAQLIANSQSVVINERGERDVVYTIPVVFHIIHEYGAENITDAQVHSQMDILNIDYRLLNPDTTEIMTEFKALAADCNIEFKLASIDPFGNCTNGIEHINSHETQMGDDASKLNQWPRSRYLNVWVVNSMENGVAGYAYYPSAVSGGLYFADGIIILNDYIGDEGTSIPYNSRALTHEIGHWLNLPHTWGNTNDPTVACGDDNISDTPETKGHDACVLTGTDFCNVGVAENIQNYMEYAYCSRMFTIGQSLAMTTALTDVTASRDNLWSATNAAITGIDVTVPLCAPVADFTVSKQLICAGSSVTFTGASWRAPVDTYSWHFVGGTPEFSSTANANVTYDTPGIYDVILTVTNASGSDTKTMTSYMVIEGDWYDYNGPFSEGFETIDLGVNWIVQNPENDASKFEIIEGAGYSGTHAVGIIHYKDNLDPILDLNYMQRLGGEKDILISPVYNLDNTTGGYLNFRYAHATISAGLFEDENLNLRVFYTVNCGTTWLMIENIQDLDVMTAGYQGGNFHPTSSTLWETAIIPLPGAALQEQVRFKFEFTAADFSNNFFLDDINVNGILLTEENNININEISIFPNPLNAGQTLKLSYELFNNETVYVTIYDMLGNVVKLDQFAGVAGSNLNEVNFANINLTAGIYTVSVRTETAVKNTKLLIQ